MLNDGKTGEVRIRHAIRVTDAAEAPTFATDGTVPALADNPQNRPQIHPANTAIDIAEGRTQVGWFRIADDHPHLVDVRLEGADRHLFRVIRENINDVFWLHFRAPPDHETPGDHDGDGVYDVTLVLRDRDTQPLDSPDETKLPLTVAVTDVTGPMAFDQTGPGHSMVSSADTPNRGELVFSATHPDGDAVPVLDGPGVTASYRVNLKGISPSRPDDAAISAWGRFGKWILVKLPLRPGDSPGSFTLYYEAPHGWLVTPPAAGEIRVDSIMVTMRTDDAVAGNRLVEKTVYAIVTGRGTGGIDIRLTTDQPAGHAPPDSQLMLWGPRPDIDGDGTAEDRHRAFINEMEVGDDGIRLGEIWFRRADNSIDVSATRPTLTGNELGWFELRQNASNFRWELWLKPGAALNYEALPENSAVTVDGKSYRHLSVTLTQGDGARRRRRAPTRSALPTCSTETELSRMTRTKNDHHHHARCRGAAPAALHALQPVRKSVCNPLPRILSGMELLVCDSWPADTKILIACRDRSGDRQTVQRGLGGGASRSRPAPSRPERLCKAVRHIWSAGRVRRAAVSAIHRAGSGYRHCRARLQNPGRFRRL